MSDHLLEVRDLCAGYGTSRVLDGVAFDGQVYADGRHGTIAWLGLEGTCQKVGGNLEDLEALVRSRDYEHAGLYGFLVPGFLRIYGRQS